MRPILWLRIAYWAGIIADAVVAVQMLFPRLMLRAYGIDLTPTPEFEFGLRYGAPLMIGWTVLLYWADRKPVERKDVLLITAFPVVAGYIAVAVYAIAAGFASLGQLAPAFVMQAVLLTLFGVGYRQGRRLAADSTSDAT